MRSAKHLWKPTLSVFLLGLSLGLPAIVMAEDEEALIAPLPTSLASPLSTPSTRAEDPAFLNLPAFDVEGAPTTHIRVGDSLSLKISGLSFPGITDATRELALVVPPGTESLNDQGWELGGASAPAASSGPATSSAPPSVLASELSFRGTPLKPGKITLPSLAIVRADGNAESVAHALGRTHPFTIDVESAVKADDPKPEEAADLRPPVSLRFPWWLVAVGALLGVALAVAAYFVYRKYAARKPKPATTLPKEPPKPEDEVALAALAELERSGPLKRGEFKSHYFGVSEILKAYIGARYGFDAMESTTREMISSLEERKAVEDSRLDRLETMFAKLDLVKFTDHVPLPDEGGHLAAQAKEWVLATRRVPAPAAATDGKEATR